MGLWLTEWEVRDGAGPPEPVASGTPAGGFGGCGGCGGSQAGDPGGGLSGMGDAISVMAYCLGLGLIGGGVLARVPLTGPSRHCWELACHGTGANASGQGVVE